MRRRCAAGARSASPPIRSAPGSGTAGRPRPSAGQQRGDAMKAWFGILLAGLGLVAAAAAPAQAAGEARDGARHGAGLEVPRGKANAGTVGIISGGVEGTYIRIAADLSAVLDGSE